MNRWSDCLTKKHQTRGKKEAKPNKYKARRTALGFPSHLEESVYADLLYRQKAGEYRDVERYPSIELMPGVRWKCDFKAFDIALGETVYIEAKGIITERYALIVQMWPTCGTGLLREYKGSKDRVWVSREIKGKK